MRCLLGVLVLVRVVLWAGTADAAQSEPVAVVAAENSYGVIAQAIGGKYVDVFSIIKNPNTDPHEFEADPPVARRVARARIVLLNGIGYDTWMEKLLAANPASGRQVVIAAALDPHLVMADQNPHIFYDPRVALLTAARLARLFSQDDPAHAAIFRQNLERFSKSLLQVYAGMQSVIAGHPALTVTATEPVFGYMLRLLGYDSVNRKFQFNVMNNTEPSPAEIVRYSNSLRQHKVSVLFYNKQVNDPLMQTIKTIARQAHIPIIGVDEFVPPNTGYVQWQVDTLSTLEAALKTASNSTPAIH